MQRACKRCGHLWRPRQDVPPIQCPLCRSPYWDKERLNVERTSRENLVNQSADSERDSIGRSLEGIAVSFLQTPTVPAERLRAVPEVRSELVDRNRPEPEPAREACTYREYDSESGEWYGCSLDVHGPKVKHVRGGRVV